MYALLVLLGACDGGFHADQDAVLGLTPSVTVVVEVESTARVREVAGAAAWTARVRMARHTGEAAERLPPNVCRPVEAANVAPGSHRAEDVTITGPGGGPLGWDAAGGDYRAAGPRRVSDPSWAIGDLRWREGAVERVVEGIVRFGAAPVVTRVDRDAEGAVHIRWDPHTVGETQVLAQGPAGDLVCGATSTGVDLPWWSVPALGGEVVLRSMWTRATLTERDVLVRARATLERVILLDAPPEVASEPSLLLPPPGGVPTSPRKVRRTAASPMG